MRIWLTSAAMLAAVGCANCPALEGGDYEITGIEDDGTCGPLAAIVVPVTVGELPYLGTDDACTGRVAVSADGCRATFDRRCPRAPDGEIHYEGESEVISSRAARVSFTRSVMGAGVECTSSYRAMAIHR